MGSGRFEYGAADLNMERCGANGPDRRRKRALDPSAGSNEFFEGMDLCTSRYGMA